MELRYDNKKNQKIKADKDRRGIDFEIVCQLIENDRILDFQKSQTRENQYYFVVNFNNYAFVVPVVIDEEKDEIFLKTVFPSRKATKKYLKE